MRGGALREKLRAETAAIHARLHRHPGLSAAASGAIDRNSYRALLIRLYGFHRAFEAHIGAFTPLEEGSTRSALLASDLEALGVASDEREAIPLCVALAPIFSSAEALGALYVVEGSTLGGAHIARALQSASTPPGGAKGYRFFSNDGVSRPAWKELLARLEAIRDPREERAAIAAAVSTFRAFEDWMKDWALAMTASLAS